MIGKRLIAGISFTIVFLLCVPYFAGAANRYSVATGNWNAVSTWSATSGGTSGASAPVAGDIVYIERGFTVTTTAAAACATLIINDASNASSLVIGAFTFTVSGTTAIGGGISGSNLTISSATGTKTFTGAVTINNGGSFIENAAATLSFGSDVTIHTGGVFTEFGAAVVGIAGNISNSGTYTASTGVHTISGASKTITGTLVLPSLAVTGSYTNTDTLTVSTALTGAGKLTQGTDAILNLAGTSTITNLDATASGNMVNYINTTAAQTIKGTTYYHLTINKATGFAGTLGAAATVNGNLLVLAGTFADGGYQITGNSTGTLTVANGATLQIGAGTNTTESFPSLFTTDHISLGLTSTVNYYWVTGTSQIVGGSIGSIGPSTYGNLTITGTTGTKTMESDITVAGNFNIASAGQIISDGGHSITVNGNIVNNGRHTGNGKIILSGGSTVHAISGGTSYFGNLELDDTQGATLTGTGTTTISGNLTVTTGEFTLNTITTAFVVTGNTNLSGTLNITDATGTKTFAGDVLINSSGIWNNSINEAVTFTGNFQNDGTFTAGTATQTFTGVSKTISGTSIPIAIPIASFYGAYTNTTTLTCATSLAVIGVTLTNNGSITTTTALAGSGVLANSELGILTISGTCSITTLTNSGTTTINGAGAITTALANFSNTGTLYLNGSGAITGITNKASGTVNLASSGTITAFNNATSTSTLNISAAAVPTITTLTATAVGNTVKYNASVAQTGCKVTTYDNLTIAGSGSKTFATTPTVNGILSMEGTATIVVTTGVVTYGANATLQYNTATARTSSSEEWISGFSGSGGIIIAGTGIITTDAAKLCPAASLSILNGAVLDLGTFTTHTCRSLSLGGSGTLTGTWGGTGSGATNINTTFFAANSGRITVGSSTLNWTGATSTDWNTGSNWSGGTVPTSIDNVIITSAPANQPVIDALNGTCYSITELAGGTVSGIGTLTIGNTNAIAAVSSNAVISCNVSMPAVAKIANGSNLTISGIITGAGTSLTKTGVGILTLSGANTYTGSTTISGGIVKLGASSSISTEGPLGTTGGATTVALGATLDLNGYSLTNSATEPLSINGTGVGGLGALTNSSSTASTYIGVITFVSAASIVGEGGPVTITGTPLSSAIAITIGGSAGGSFASDIAGARSVTKEGTGTWILSGVNTYTGNTILRAGTLKLGSTTALGASAATTVVIGAVLDLNGYTLTTARPLTLNGTGLLASPAGALTNTGGDAEFSGAITLGTTPTITVTSSGTLTLSGNCTGNNPLVINGSGTGTFSGIKSGTSTLTKIGTSTWILSGVNTYTGYTYIREGILKLGSTTALGVSASTSITSGAVLDLNGFTLSTARPLILNGTGILSGGALTNTSTTAATYSGALTFATAASIVGENGTIAITGTPASSTTAITLGGTAGGSVSTVIAGARVLTKEGTGTWTLSGLSTYSGATIVNSGILKAGVATTGNNGAFGYTSAVTLANVAGVMLDITGFNNTIGSLSGGGSIGGNVTLGAATLTIGNNNKSTVFEGIISGTGAITKSGTGVLTLSGTNSYSGNTTISAGTLKLGNVSAIGTIDGIVTVSSGGVLDLNGFTLSTAKPLTLNGTGLAALPAGALTNNGGDASYSGAITLASASTITVTTTGTLSLSGDCSGNFALTLSGSGMGTYSGIRSGTSTIVKTGTGTWILSGTNTYTGATTISAGTLKLGASTSVLGTTAGITSVTSGAVLDLNGYNLTTSEPLTLNGAGLAASPAGALTNTGGNVIFSGPITLGSAGTITVTATGTLTCSGNVGAGAYSLILDGTTGSSGTMSGILSTPTSVVKNGTGTWTLSGTNTYTGVTNISAGTLKVGASTSILGSVAGLTLVTSGAVLDLNGFNVSNAEPLTLNGTGLSASPAGALTNTGGNASFIGPITLGASGATITTTSSGTLSCSGAVGGNTYPLILDGTGIGTMSGIIGTGTGTITKIGSGTWILSGVSTYSGLTTISEGTLKLGASTSALGTIAGITIVNTGAVLDLNGFTLTTAEPLTLNGTGISNGGAFINSGASATYNGAITLSSTSSIGPTGNITLGASGISGDQDLTKVGNGILNLGSGTVSLGGLIINTGTLTSTSGTMNISGHFTNNNTFLHNNGTIIYNGSIPQSIGGTGSNIFNNTTINNAAGVTLTSPLSSSVVTLSNGLLTTTSSNLLTVTGITSSSITGSALSYVNGPLLRTLPASLVNGNYLFPIGKSGYNPFSLIEANTSSASNIGIIAEVEDANCGGTPGIGLSTLKTNRYWAASISSGTSFTSSKIQLTETGLVTEDAIGKSSTLTGIYDRIGNDPPSGNTITSDAVTSLGYFAISEKPILTIAANQDGTEGNTDGEFIITTTSQFSVDRTINVILTGSAANGIDYSTINTTITFPANQYSVTVPVTVIDDASVESTETVIITLDAGTTYTIGTPSTATVNIIDNDISGITLTPTSGLTTTEDLGTATFSLVLNSLPTADVSIVISSNDLTEGSVSPASVTFTTANWNTPQTVTATGVNDFIVDGNITYSIITAPASSTDFNYNNLDAADISITNTDNDVAGITINPTSSLVTTEDLGTATFTIVLTSQPTSEVSIDLSSDDTSEGTVSPLSVTFSAANWNAIQTVTVTGVNDDIIDGDIPYSIVTAQASSADLLYASINPPDVSIINYDNDVAGITVTPTTGLQTSEAGGQATFTIVLTSQPSDEVTLSLTSDDISEGIVSPSSITFTNANWNVAQTITVTGVDGPQADGDITYHITTGIATSSDSNFNGIDPSDVTVINFDNDVAGIFVNPTSVTTTEAGGTATFSVVLNTQPVADVTIGLTSNNTYEGTLSVSSITFTDANWNLPQTITISGVNDDVDDGNVLYTITGITSSTDGNYEGMSVQDVSVTNTDDDLAGITISTMNGSTSETGTTASFTIVLNSQPIADVTVGLSSNDVSEGTVSPTSVNFTSANWNIPQTVTVTGVNDDVQDGTISYTIISGQATSTDPLYNAINPSDVPAINTDNDIAGFTFSSTSGFITTEAGDQASFTVNLNSEPTANVVITLTSGDISEGTVSPTSITFTPMNWSNAQTVTITGIDDDVVDGIIGYTILTTVSPGGDAIYNVIDPTDISVSNNDNDVAGFTVNPTNGLSTTEAGGTANFTIKLTSQPTANVTIELSSSDLSEGMASPSTITFTSGNWNINQTITVTGINDDVDDGDISYSIINSPATSSDNHYNTLDPSDVLVTNTDNDEAGITVSTISGSTTESGGTATFTIVLNSQPNASVFIGISSSNTDEGTDSTSLLTFTTSNWSSSQAVTITGVDDYSIDGNINYTIVTTTASSSDASYNGLNVNDVSVSNIDNDIPGITITPTTGLSTDENGSQASFTMVMNNKPSAIVTINLSSDLTEGTVSPTSVTFTPSNWNTVQLVTVTGVNDDIDDGDIPYTIVTATAISSDVNYNGFDALDVTIVNNDDDLAGITVMPVSGLTTTEAGGTASFSIHLNSEPTDDIIINITSCLSEEGTAAPPSITFTPLNWSTSQTITITGADDFKVDGDVEYIIENIVSPGADAVYNLLDPSDVTVTNTDNDVAGFVVDPTNGLITSEAGETATFTIKLTSQPTDDVTIDLSSTNTSEGMVSPSSVTFNNANWDTEQTVTLTGINDAVTDGDIAYTIITDEAISIDPYYSSLNPVNVTATNTDLTPTIGSFSPTAMCYSSGESIVITGTYFADAISVEMNDIPVSFTVNNDNQITAEIPANSTSGLIKVITITGTAVSGSSLIVDPISVGGSVSGGTTICSGSNSGTLTLSGHTGNVTKWQSSVSPFSIWDDIANTTTTYISDVLTQTTRFRAVVTSGECSSVNSTETTVTVDPISVGGSVTGGTTICSGNTSGTLTLNDYTGNILKWQYSVSPFSTWIDITNTSTTYISDVLTQTTQFRAVVVNGVCSSANSSSTTVTVDDLSTLISLQSTDYNCPELSSLTGFNPNNNGPYNPGATEVIFRVTRLNSLATNWEFDYEIQDATVSGTSPNSQTGTITGITTTDYNIHFYIVNTPGMAINLTFLVKAVRDSNGCSNLTNQSITDHINAMPVVGAFN